MIYFQYSYTNMTYVKSDIDNLYYLVRNVSDKRQAANTLARIRENVIHVANYLFDHRTDKLNMEYVEYINLLHSKINNIIIIESTQDSIYTSYSINKGEQIIFCIRSRKNDNKLHDINEMMYVALHEISHVACPIYDNHGPLFKKIFAFIATTAVNIGLYKKMTLPKEYCGIMITESII